MKIKQSTVSKKTLVKIVKVTKVLDYIIINLFIFGIKKYSTYLQIWLIKTKLKLDNNHTRTNNKQEIDQIFTVTDIVRPTILHYFSSSDWSTFDFLLTDVNSRRKCAPVKYKKRQKAGFPIVT